MSSKKKIIFVTSTRADFGKLKSLIKIIQSSKDFEAYIVITGMHMIKEFGSTYLEVTKIFRKNVIKFSNQNLGDNLDVIMSKTIKNFSQIVKKVNPDLIVIHGDRVEALACSTVGALNHILTAHVEGGEVSGTIDDSIRHAITKLSHVHFIGSTSAKKRVSNMGEDIKNIYKIGSPDIDIILNDKLPTLKQVRKRYDINFKEYGIVLWHPVTSDLNNLSEDTGKLIEFLKKMRERFVVIYPNNDPGSNIVLKHYRLFKKKKFRLLKSLRFEYFLTLLKNSNFIIGNSSSAIYEAPLLGIPAINIGDRQFRRTNLKNIKNVNINDLDLGNIYKYIKDYKKTKKSHFGYGNSDKKFLKILKTRKFWQTNVQKFFFD